MPDLVIRTVNGVTMYSVDYIGKAVTIERPLGSEQRIEISDAHAALPLDDLRKMVEAGIIR